LQALLGSGDQTLRACEATSSPASQQEILIKSAKNWALSLSDLAFPNRRSFLLRVVSRITVVETCVEVSVDGARLAALLLGESVPKSHSDATSSKSGTNANATVLRAEARLIRVGGITRMVLADESAEKPASQVDPALVKAISRARQWYEMLISGAVPSIDALAQKNAVGESYVRRILRLAFLAPDVVETILDGRQPLSLTVEKLRHGVPLAWEQQRSMLTAGHTIACVTTLPNIVI